MYHDQIDFSLILHWILWILKGLTEHEFLEWHEFSVLEQIFNWTRISRIARIWPLNRYDSFDSCNSCSDAITCSSAHRRSWGRQWGRWWRSWWLSGLFPFSLLLVISDKCLIFPQITQIFTDYRLLRSFLQWDLISIRPLLATKRICANLWDLWETLSESHCKDTTFHFPNSPMLIVAHRYSPIITDKYQGSPKWKKI